MLSKYFDLPFTFNAHGQGLTVLPSMTPDSTKEIDVKIDSCEYIEDRDSNVEEVLVHRENINGKEYLISGNNVVFDSKTYKMLGRFVLGKIIYV